MGRWPPYQSENKGNPLRRKKMKKDELKQALRKIPIRDLFEILYEILEETLEILVNTFDFPRKENKNEKR